MNEICRNNNDNLTDRCMNNQKKSKMEKSEKCKKKDKKKK